MTGKGEEGNVQGPSRAEGSHRQAAVQHHQKECYSLRGEHCHQELGTAALGEPALGSSRLQEWSGLPLVCFETHHVAVAYRKNAEIWERRDGSR